MFKSFYNSPLGLIAIEAKDSGIDSIQFINESVEMDEIENYHTKECKRQLNEYFNGKLKRFDLEFNLKGTEFQKLIWTQLQKVLFGETKSYNELAEIIGDIKKVRAVANANAKNPLAIVVPCHRIIGSDGKLTGYAGGLWRKDWLLKHEAEFSNKDFQTTLF